jgi:diacylglycerol O-acyltransferase
VLTDDETFNDPHEATDALRTAFSELRSAAGLSGGNSTVGLMAEHALR